MANTNGYETSTDAEQIPNVPLVFREICEQLLPESDLIELNDELNKVSTFLNNLENDVKANLKTAYAEWQGDASFYQNAWVRLEMVRFSYGMSLVLPSFRFTVHDPDYTGVFWEGNPFTIPTEYCVGSWSPAHNDRYYFTLLDTTGVRDGNVTMDNFAAENPNYTATTILGTVGDTRVSGTGAYWMHQAGNN